MSTETDAAAAEAAKNSATASATSAAASATTAAEALVEATATFTAKAQAAAGDALIAEIAGRDLLDSQTNADDAFRIRDEGNHEAFAVGTDGRTKAHDLVTSRISSEASDIRWTWRDDAGHVAAQIREDGSTFIADPRFTDPTNPVKEIGLADLAVGGLTTVTKVRFLVMLGQSNGEGRQKPTSVRIDPTDPALEMWDWASKSLVTATVPLSSQQTQTGKSPLTTIGREHLKMVGTNTRVVLLNAAAGGTGLLAEPVQGTWHINYAGANPQMFNITKAELDLARAAIATKYPAATIEVWFYWHQGESDTATEAAYGAALDALFGALRTHQGDQTIPFAAGGVVPEHRTPIGPDLALINLPARLEYVGYTDGVRNGGGSQNMGDTVHYGREGGERLALRMHEAGLRAAIASSASIAHKPLDVTATFIAGTLQVDWSTPMCRYTAFICQYRIDGGSWVAATRTIACDVHQTVTGLTGNRIEVRVATVNGADTTEYTTPITALGAGHA